MVWVSPMAATPQQKDWFRGLYEIMARSKDLFLFKAKIDKENEK